MQIKEILYKISFQTLLFKKTKTKLMSYQSKKIFSSFGKQQRITSLETVKIVYDDKELYIRNGIKKGHLNELIHNFHKSPILFLAKYLLFLLYSFTFYLYNLAASTFAGESRLGSTNIEVILMITASIVKIGFHFYSTFSIGFIGSSNGG